MGKNTDLIVTAIDENKKKADKNKKKLDLIVTAIDENKKKLKLSRGMANQVDGKLKLSRDMANQVDGKLITKLKRAWAAEDVRIKYVELRANAKALRDAAKANDNYCANERDQEMNIMSAVPLTSTGNNEEIDDKSCI